MAKGGSGARGRAGGARGGGARGGAGGGGARGSAKGASPRRSAKGASPAGAKASGRNRPKPPAKSEPAPILPDRFTLGVVPGATPGKWISVWRERMPQVELELRQIAVADQRDALLAPGGVPSRRLAPRSKIAPEGPSETGDDDHDTGAEASVDHDTTGADASVDHVAEVRVLDAALVRLPIDRDGLNVITLYDEVPVVVVPKDSHLTAADELDLADLAGEVAVVPLDDVLGLEVPGAVAPRFEPPADTEQAIATVAAGVGFVVVPMSLARLHHRKDVEHRPLRGGPVSTVALAWPADRTTPLVDTFVGIVRGRTANSSR